MEKWIISWDSGLGKMYEIVQVETEEDALESAYESAEQEFKSNVYYNAIPYTKEKAIELELEFEGEEKIP